MCIEPPGREAGVQLPGRRLAEDRVQSPRGEWGPQGAGEERGNQGGCRMQGPGRLALWFRQLVPWVADVNGNAALMGSEKLNV